MGLEKLDLYNCLFLLNYKRGRFLKRVGLKYFIILNVRLMFIVFRCLFLCGGWFET